jgi:hypothetical protein
VRTFLIQLHGSWLFRSAPQARKKLLVVVKKVPETPGLEPRASAIEEIYKTVITT